ncbi:hypothetical protein AVEN_133146-1 [Araneus ventricosus]|uniref:Uncharacterized protein n=1 Tax=Araneus ventricosus TaxID=182803 RepID=A0A4Y2SBB0_ARAVE|nr:hypothetical protein AVEN_133146-1 [Araneus ventricosus]
MSRFMELRNKYELASFRPTCTCVKPRSYDLSFHEFRPRFASLPVVRTGRIDVICGLVSASVISRVMAVNSSHVKGGGVARGRQCIHSLERCREICQATYRRNGATVRNSTHHSLSTNLEQPEVCQATRHGKKTRQTAHAL